ncbi:glycoside hydrolase family 81 protein [Polychaeton citri CBS 116435]|uniref:glucan endo-1,3-beta-D-glucosidase n=1 Tax=Polychaeton citri CBS 116435 TaxID=1314669 RepID=A0A9P4PYE1_9PEZI|nr:glycoside hydrolase family 81 protein [Polychaeton citri CBS 116435]
MPWSSQSEPEPEVWHTTYTVHQISDGQVQGPPWDGLPTSSLSSSASVSASQQTPASPQVSTLTSFVTRDSTVTRYITTTIPESQLTSLTTSAVQSASNLPSPSTDSSDITQTSLDTSGLPPFPSPTTLTASTSLSLVDTSTVTRSLPTPSQPSTLSVKNIFQPIATDSPPAQISQVGTHPVSRTGVQTQEQKLQTNKFFVNFFLGDQNQPSWTHPYSVFWAKGGGATQSWGLSISHVDRDAIAPGPDDNTTGAWSYFVNPLGVQWLVMSAAELNSQTSLTTDSIDAFSINVNLVAEGQYYPAITFPLVQGMGFVTGVYRGYTPLIQSGVGVNQLTYGGTVDQAGRIHKYTAQLADTTSWLMYVTPSNSTYNANSFTLINSQNIQGSSGFHGVIQISKSPVNGTRNDTSVYDRTAGAYATGVNITGNIQGSTGSYTLTRSKQGVSDRELLMFALPHHVQSLSNQTRRGVTSLNLVTTTKGMATGIVGDSWTLLEPDLPIDMGFAPWTPELRSVTNVSSSAMAAINAAGLSELSQDMSEQTDLNSVYYAGKGLAKFAGIIYSLHDISGNTSLALTGLEQLEINFARWVNNSQQFPLYYESAWGGTVSSASYSTGDAGVDFGNTYYNDHHFHYGYFVYTAAVIAYLDPDWLDQGTNKAWVNNLVRDYAGSVSDDPYYPFSRMFDWFHGHSWAGGLFEAADGRNQESSSEDTMASYAIKMWGHVTGDENMEARGNLMLGLQARSLSNYYLYLSNNTVEPSEFIGNKVAGILFDNKIDHTTYFGTNIEYIQGIHMLPQLPLSTYTRSKEFVQQEWDTYFTTYVNEVQGGWRGILMANYAVIDPVAAYDFFNGGPSGAQFDETYLDGGASQTWYLTYSAALGGSPASTPSSARRALDGGEEVSEKVSTPRSMAEERSMNDIDSRRDTENRQYLSGRSRSPRLRQRARGREGRRRSIW